MKIEEYEIRNTKDQTVDKVDEKTQIHLLFLCNKCLNQAVFGYKYHRWRKLCYTKMRKTILSKFKWYQ